jgi:hypothetical protein
MSFFRKSPKESILNTTSRQLCVYLTGKKAFTEEFKQKAVDLINDLKKSTPPDKLKETFNVVFTAAFGKSEHAWGSSNKYINENKSAIVKAIDKQNWGVVELLLEHKDNKYFNRYDKNNSEEFLYVFTRLLQSFEQGSEHPHAIAMFFIGMCSAVNNNHNFLHSVDRFEDQCT